MGLRNMIVVAVASGVVRMPALNIAVVAIRNTERSNCCFGWRLTARAGRLRPQAIAATTVAKKKRAQVT